VVVVVVVMGMVMVIILSVAWNASQRGRVCG
jgi:hypothetical protein